MKKQNLIILISFVLLACCVSVFFWFLLENYKKDVLLIDIPSGNIDCLLFGGSSLQRLACLRNLDATKSKTPDSDLNAILETLCSTGNATGCIIKGQLAAINQRVGLSATTPYNLSWLSDNCINTHKKSISDADRLTSCALLEKYADIVNAKYTKSFTQQQLCSLNPQKCLNEVSNNYMFSLEQNNNLYNENCAYKWKNEISNKYCEELDKVINFQIPFLQLITSIPQSGVDYTKKFEIICQKNKGVCLQIINQPVYLNALIQLDKKFNLDYFDNYYIHTTAGLYLYEKLNIRKMIKTPKNRILLFLKNYEENKHFLNLQICENNSDKDFCFLSFKTLEEAQKNIKKINSYCENGDGISCSYKTIIANTSVLGLDPKKQILHYFQDYESFALDYLQTKNKPISILSFLNNNRYWIISFLLSANLFFILYFMSIFSKIGHVYKYLKNEKIKEIKEKIKKH